MYPAPVLVLDALRQQMPARALGFHGGVCTWDSLEEGWRETANDPMSRLNQELKDSSDDSPFYSELNPL